MEEEEWGDPYAVHEEETREEVQVVVLESESKGGMPSVMARVLEDKRLGGKVRCGDREVRIRELYGDGVTPFDFSTPSPDDRARMDKVGKRFSKVK